MYVTRRYSACILDGSPCMYSTSSLFLRPVYSIFFSLFCISALITFLPCLVLPHAPQPQPQYPPVLVLDVPTKSFENPTPRSLPPPYLRVIIPYENSYRGDKNRIGSRQPSRVRGTSERSPPPISPPTRQTQNARPDAKSVSAPRQLINAQTNVRETRCVRK